MRKFRKIGLLSGVIAAAFMAGCASLDGDGDLTDADGDGFIECNGSQEDDKCDCDDKDQWVNPGQAEVCGDGNDNDCDGVVDDGCPSSPVCTTNCNPGNTTCPSGYTLVNGVCQPTNNPPVNCPTGYTWNGSVCQPTGNPPNPCGSTNLSITVGTPTGGPTEICLNIELVENLDAVFTNWNPVSLGATANGCVVASSATYNACVSTALKAVRFNTVYGGDLVNNLCNLAPPSGNPALRAPVTVVYNGRSYTVQTYPQTGSVCWTDPVRGYLCGCSAIVYF